MSMSIRRTGALIAATAALSLLATACSSSGGSKTTPTTSAATGSSTTTTSTGSSAPSSAPAGAPILIGGSGSLNNPAYSEPGLRDGEEAAVASINAAGGVNGHPLKLDFCASDYDVNKELSCARKLAAAKVAAVVHGSILADSSGAEFKIYEQAGIAFFGGYGLSPAEENSPISYPLGSGDLGWFAGAAKSLKLAGVTKVAIYADSNPGSQYSGGLIPQTLAGLGLTSTGVFTADPKADPTFAASAAKLVGSGAQGVILTPGPVNFPGMVKALKQAGYTGKLSTITALITYAIKPLGSLANGILLDSFSAFQTDTSNSGVSKWLADMKQYDPKGVVDDQALSGWSAVQLFAKIMATSKATTLDNTAFLDALKNLDTPVDIGSVAPYSVKGKVSPFPKVATQIFNDQLFFGSVVNGVITTDGKGPSSAFK